MILKDVGSIIKMIRSEILKLNQVQLAEQVDSSQILISRLERGHGASVLLLLKVIDYFRSVGINAHNIFYEPFDRRLLLKESDDFGEEINPSSVVNQLINLIIEVDKTTPTEKDKRQIEFLMSKLISDKESNE